MDPRSEVVIRQQEYLTESVLFINAPSDQLLKTLNPATNHQVWTWNFADFQYFQAQHIPATFGIEIPASPFDQVVIFVPKSKELLNYLLNQVLSQLQIGQSVFLVGEKKGGVERAAKQLQPYGKILKIDSARHCQMWHLSIAHTETRKPLEAWLQSYSLAIEQQSIEIFALPGVFSQKHLDVGTAVLLPFLQEVKNGEIADFGCGAGIMSCYLAKLHPQNNIFALDIDAFALASTRITAERNHLSEQIKVIPVTGITDAPQQLDAIVSNPPFHQGIHTHYDASEQLCQQSKLHLKTGGELWIVANRFLNYAPIIERSFGQHCLKTDTQGFKVLMATA